MKVSVIIPTYNRSQYVCEAIDSVLAQTYQDFEIIVVDDGSTDDTKEQLEAYGARIRYIAQENAGPGVARNRGILEARGDYVAFLDSDDMWYPTKLEKQVAVLDNQPTVGFVYCDCTRGPKADICAKGHFSEVRPASGNIFDQLIHANYVFTPGVLVRRDVLARSGTFDPTLQTAQDYDLWLRLAHCSTCVYLDERMFHVREHDGRISYDLHKMEFRCRSREIQAARWGFLPGLGETFRRRAAQAYVGCAWAHRVSGEYVAAYKMYREASRCSPGSLRLQLMAFLVRWVTPLFRWYDRNARASAAHRLSSRSAIPGRLKNPTK